MLTCLLAALPALGQVTAPVDCNNQTRHKTTCAGNTSTGMANCASFSFTITVAGQSFTFSSPSSCDTGRREQDKDCYDCGPSSSGNHCKARGFKANVKVYSIGGGSPCPTIPDPLPTTLADASAAVQCKPLPKRGGLHSCKAHALVGDLDAEQVAHHLLAVAERQGP